MNIQPKFTDQYGKLIYRREKPRRAMTAWQKFAVSILIIVSPFVVMAAATQVNLATQVFGVLPTANGGTGSAFFAISGPTATRTYALPDASATILTSNTSVTVAQGGTGAATTAGALTNLGLQPYGTLTTTDYCTYVSGTGIVCNSAGAAPTFYQEVPSGTVNGSNTSFTLAHTPTSAASVILFENGIGQTQGAGADYTISSGTITYLTAPPTGSILLAQYH